MSLQSNFVPARAFGKLAEDTSKPKLVFSDFASVLPSYPTTSPKPAGITYPMDHNDYVGCCVVAGLDHALRAIYTQLTGSYKQPTDAELLRWYQSQNPDFTDWSQGGTDADQGMIIAQFLSWAIKNVKDENGKPIILGYAKVDHTNAAELRAANYIFEAVITGEDVRQAQMSTKDWSYTPNSPDDGGHCTVNVGYDDKRYNVVTWGEDDYLMEENYMTSSVDEAYVIITQAHVDNPGFRNNFDLAAFANAYKQITGKDFPVVVPTPTPPAPTPVPPQPEPTPPPTPQPTPGSVTLVFTADEAATVDVWANAPHWWAKATKAAKVWKLVRSKK